MPTSSKFYDLSAELLTIIAEEYYSLILDPDCADWTCTFENFKAIVQSQALPDTSWNYGDRKKLLEQYLQDCITFDEDNFREGYKEYQSIALANQEYLESHKSNFTRATWTDVFCELENVYIIEFIGFDATDAGWPKQLPDPHKCAIQPFSHSDQDEQRRVIAAPVGDALFELGIESLAEAEVCLQSLHIDCAMTGHFGWENITGWEKLDLSSLQDFDFNPWASSYYCCGEDVEPPETHEVIAASAADAITNIMKKYKDSLESFTYGDRPPMIWPGTQVIELPNLKMLSLECGYIEAENLQRWLAEMPSLEDLSLIRVGVQKGRYWKREHRDWLHVFDAIRDHPGRPRCELDDINIDGWGSLGLGYKPDNIEEVLQQPPDDDYQAYRQSIALYMNGKSELKDIMRVVFAKEND